MAKIPIPTSEILKHLNTKKDKLDNRFKKYAGKYTRKRAKLQRRVDKLTKEKSIL